MSFLKFSNMTTPQLLSFYNRHSTVPVKRFRDRKTAERRCTEVFDTLLKEGKAIKQKVDNSTTRPSMKASLKLDRTLICLSSGETWKNAYQMWRDHPDWLTSAQQDRLTAQLYAAAKIGEQKIIQINERSFMLVAVSGATA